MGGFFPPRETIIPSHAWQHSKLLLISWFRCNQHTVTCDWNSGLDWYIDSGSLKYKSHQSYLKILYQVVMRWQVHYVSFIESIMIFRSYHCKRIHLQKYRRFSWGAHDIFSFDYYSTNPTGVYDEISYNNYLRDPINFLLLYLNWDLQLNEWLKHIRNKLSFINSIDTILSSLNLKKYPN